MNLVNYIVSANQIFNNVYPKFRLGEEWSELCWDSKLKLCEKNKKTLITAATSTTTKSNEGDFQSSVSIHSYSDSGFDSSSNPATSSSSLSSNIRTSPSCQITGIYRVIII